MDQKHFPLFRLAWITITYEVYAREYDKIRVIFSLFIFDLRHQFFIFTQTMHVITTSSNEGYIHHDPHHDGISWSNTHITWWSYHWSFNFTCFCFFQLQLSNHSTPSALSVPGLGSTPTRLSSLAWDLERTTAWLTSVTHKSHQRPSCCISSKWLPQAFSSICESAWDLQMHRHVSYWA